jgi:transmembrane 9 superfamily member 2/4
MARLGARLLAVVVAAALLSTAPGVRGFYLPGSYPHKYSPREPLNVKVNSLTSIDTEMPFGY